MHDIHSRIADVLLEVEANLRTSGKWDHQQPEASHLESRIPFCMDTLRFEQWLQWIFLPKMKLAIEQTTPLPTNSSILVYAKECLHKDDPGTHHLLKLIKRFDDLIEIQSSVKLQ